MSDARAAMPCLNEGGIDTDPDSTGQITLMPKTRIKGLAISMAETLIQHLHWIGEEYNVSPSLIPGSATNPVLMEKLDDFLEKPMAAFRVQNHELFVWETNFSNPLRLSGC